jgi:hypothetical protein
VCWYSNQFARVYEGGGKRQQVRVVWDVAHGVREENSLQQLSLVLNGMWWVLGAWCWMLDAR